MIDFGPPANYNTERYQCICNVILLKLVCTSLCTYNIIYIYIYIVWFMQV